VSKVVFTSEALSKEWFVCPREEFAAGYGSTAIGAAGVGEEAFEMVCCCAAVSEVAAGSS